DRHHPADRPGEEERDHDDRLRARGRARTGHEPARGDPPRRAAALPPDPDDHACGAVRGDPDDVRQRLRRRAAPAARPGDGRRTGGEPGPDPVHHAGDLPVLRPLRAPRAGPGGGRRRRRDGVVMEPARLNLSELFIRRPVATVLLAVAVVLCGLLALARLPVAPLPQVDYPAIQVSAYLPGASPESMAATVATPLERALGSIPGITRLTSNSSQGSSRIDLRFSLDRNVDDAAREVQAAINTARAQLPSGMPGMPQLRKINPSQAPIMTLALSSATLTPSQVFDVASTVIAQKIAQLPGVGQVQASGSSLPAVRVSLNRGALNQYGIALDEVAGAIRNANALRPLGHVADGERQWQVDASLQLRTAAEYQDLIVAWRDGRPVHLRDVAHVAESTENRYAS